MEKKQKLKKRPSPTKRETLHPFSLYHSPQAPSFQEGLTSVIQLLKGKKNIIVLTGAGISVSCGIPDFRSKGTGLYATLDAQHLGLSCPEELFDYEVFTDNPRPFYRFAKHLYFPLGQKERARPSDAHKLLALLEEQKMLLRVYSQNIDGLEQEAGVSAKRVVYAHGSLQWATCIKCKHKVNSKEIEEHVFNGSIPRCREPNKPMKQLPKPLLSPTKPARSGSARIQKRQREELDNHDSTANEEVCGGVLKPGVTFFGEALHDNVRRTLEADRNKVDAVIVIGTSLSVAPMSKVISYLPPDIPRILINRTIVHPGEQQDEHDEDDAKDFRVNYVFDAYLLGFCDDIARILAKQMFSPEPELYKNGKLLAALGDDDEHYDLRDWRSNKVPKERIFLFPGAQPPSNDDESVLTYREVAQCDGCSVRIEGTIHKCVNCFDYDLCAICFPTLSKMHGDGIHHFVQEIAILECDTQQGNKR
ncbi:hypothetical protein MPSEU_000877500 [Mayamaea pseudoterrestris]|nr:hypothetical protein MPSEU_000877500 [Mayamaea pseudoterrestris]